MATVAANPKKGAEGVEEATILEHLFQVCRDNGGRYMLSAGEVDAFLLLLRIKPSEGEVHHGLRNKGQRDGRFKNTVTIARGGENFVFDILTLEEIDF